MEGNTTEQQEEQSTNRSNLAEVNSVFDKLSDTVVMMLADAYDEIESKNKNVEILITQNEQYRQKIRSLRADKRKNEFTLFSAMLAWITAFGLFAFLLFGPF